MFLAALESTYTTQKISDVKYQFWKCNVWNIWNNKIYETVCMHTVYRMHSKYVSIFCIHGQRPLWFFVGRRRGRVLLRYYQQKFLSSITLTNRDLVFTRNLFLFFSHSHTPPTNGTSNHFVKFDSILDFFRFQTQLRSCLHNCTWLNCIFFFLQWTGHECIFNSFVCSVWMFFLGFILSLF